MQFAGPIKRPELLEVSVMAHREQHGNREAKKPKKEKPKGGATARSPKWAVSEIVEAQPDAKHEDTVEKVRECPVSHGWHTGCWASPGTPAQVIDPRSSAREFFSEVCQIPTFI
jgi:hypothetical protein